MQLLAAGITLLPAPHGTRHVLAAVTCRAEHGRPWPEPTPLPVEVPSR